MNKILKYTQAKYAIFDLIAKKNLKVGDRLPPLREMDKIFPFSLICLHRALSELQEQGFLDKRQGSGIYLTRAIDTWEKRGTILFLQIEPGANSIPPEVSVLRKYFHDRWIQLDTMAVDTPSQVILEASRDCLGIFASGFVTNEWVDFLDSLGKPVLYVGRNRATSRRPTIGFDWQEAVRLAMDRLVSAGHRRIALINGDRIWYPSHLIAREYQSFAKSHHLDVTKDDMLWKRGPDALSIGHFFSGKKPYDAVLVEAGGLSDFLICSWQTNLISGVSAVAVIGETRNNLSTDRMFFVGFQGNIYRDAGILFTESLNAPDRSTKSLQLLEPYIIPTLEGNGDRSS